MFYRRLIQFVMMGTAMTALGCGGMDPGATGSINQANHSWGGYHWARTSNPFTVKLGNNVTSQWTSFLNTASADWTNSAVLDTTIVAGGSQRSRCNSSKGRVEVCNYEYGTTGWLGIASISINGEHITAGTVKLNDTYYAQAQYNTPAWRALVMCQEVGHTFGLAHQDENFGNANLNTCMDYTNLPDSNQHPNTHDYDQLVSIYSHVDTTTTVQSAVPTQALDQLTELGELVDTRGQGHIQTFVHDFGPDLKVISDVFWIEPHEGDHDHE